MNTKLFGQFLLEKGYVTREQLLHALAEQRSCTRTLGDLAVATGMLTLEGLEAIHDRQRTHEEPFSQAAVHLGLLSEAKLAQLLHPQSAERLLLGQILLSFGYISQKSLYEALAAHVTERDVDDSELVQHFRQSDLVEMGGICVSILRAVFKKTLGAPLSFQVIPAVKAVSAAQKVWSQNLTHEGDSFTLAIQVSEPEALFITQGVMGTRLAVFDELAQDAVSEFLNLLTGHVCGSLSRSGRSTSAEPPVTQHPEAFLRSASPDIALLCTSDEMQFTYMLARPQRVARPAQRWMASARPVPVG